MKITIKILAVLSLFVISSGIVLADDEPGGGFTIPNPIKCATLPDCISRITKWLIAIAVPITIVMVVVGAYQFMTSGGNPEKVSGAKKTIMYAVIGFAIILLAQVFVYVLSDLIGGEGGDAGFFKRGLFAFLDLS